MAAAGIAQFLDQLERRARVDIAQHLGFLRWGITGLGAVFGVLGSMSLVGLLYWPTLPAALTGVAGAAVVSAGGFWFARRSAASLPGLRAEVRVNLLERGLLQLALEHDPYDRLPSLRPALPGLLSKRYTEAASEPVIDRLARLVNSYEACCHDAGLMQGSAPVKPTTPPTTQDRVLYYLGMVLFIGSIPFVSELEHRFQISMWWLRLPMMIGGMALLNRSESKVAAPNPLGQSSLLTSAVRLELADILRGEHAAPTGQQTIADVEVEGAHLAIAERNAEHERSER